MTFYVYVAGPLSDIPPQYLANVARLSLESRCLAEQGYVTINPAADMLEGLVGLSAWPLGLYQERSIALLRLLQHVDGALYVVTASHADGRPSAGVQAEVDEARALRIPVAFSRQQLKVERDRAATP